MQLIIVLLFLALSGITHAADDATLSDIPYKTGEALSEYEAERCKLDVYLPRVGTGFATLVWFHGGGLTNGDKAGPKEASVRTARIARSLADAGIAVVAANYRFSPKVTFPAYVQDAAAAVAWAHGHMAEHGGDPGRIFIGGHSAGAYLALMLGVDGRYLKEAGVPLSAVAGLIPVSGQVLTHYTVRAERGQEMFAITADEAAPLHFCGPGTPPFLILYADQDAPARAEENMLLVEMMKAAGNQGMSSRLITNRTHGSIASKIVDEGDPARVAILEFIKANRAGHPNPSPISPK